MYQSLTLFSWVLLTVSAVLCASILIGSVGDSYPLFYTVILSITKKESFLNPGFDLVMAGKSRHPEIGVFSVNIAVLILQVKSSVQINTVFSEFSISLPASQKREPFNNTISK